MGKVRPEREIHHDYIETSFTITRPSNTTQYAVNDALAASTSAAYAIEVENVGKTVSDNVKIVGGYVTSTNTAALLPSLMVYLFNSPPASAVDNAAFTITDDENNNVVATITFDDWEKTAANSRGQKDSIHIPAKCGGSTTSLYALVKVLNTYTPASAEVFKFNLQIERN